MTEMTAATMTTDPRPGYDLWDAAERLRMVRRAHERFLALWAVDRLLDATVDAALPLVFDADEAVTSDKPRLGHLLKDRFFRDGLLDD